MGLPYPIVAISRVRTKDSTAQQWGTFWWSLTGNTVSDSATIGEKQYMEDWVGNWEEDNTLLSVKRIYDPVFATGTYVSGGVTHRILNGWPLDYWATGFDPNVLIGIYDPDWATLANEAVVLMNPNRPALSVPTALGEARDLPMLLRSIPEALRLRGINSFRAWARKTASMNLSYEFGWRPLVSDLKRVLRVEEAVSQRLNWLRRLRDGGSITRRIKLPDQEDVRNKDTVIWTDTYATSVQHKYTDYRRARSWVTSRWSARFPTVTIPSNEASLRKKAWDLTLGMTTGSLVETGWELLPWSWLVDWFTDVGDMLATMNNSLLLQLDSLCWCRTSTFMRSFGLVSKPAWTKLSGSGLYKKIRKERKDIRPFLWTTPIFSSVPALAGRQLAILASVAAQRVPSAGPRVVRRKRGGRRVRVRV